MDSTANLLLASHQLYARSGSIGGDPSARPPIYKAVGISLAIASGVFIGISFVIKKVGLLKANEKYNEEAGEGYGYLKNAWWWLGMVLMIIGEVCNFVAYAFVDAILVTPMGALSVVITAILSAIFLKERLSFVGKVGCFNCIIGSVVIVINAPEQSAVATIQDMKGLVISPGFLSYAGVVIVGCTVVALWLGPKYGKKTMMVYLSICSLIGGLSVVATQGLGAAIVAQIAGKSQFKEWFLYVLLVFVIATLVTEVIYLNKALNLFNAALVTPTYYVFFTSSTIVTSAILFRGFKGTASTISTVIMGFLQICAGVVLLQLSKSAKDVPDTAVFKGDLDQVRTVAEQEEPEYEPRADTIRGGASILRTVSKARSEKQLAEARKLKEETMRPIGEGEAVEFDGLRRRRTVLDPNHPTPLSRGSTIVRSKTLHPPLGMSHFPDSSSSDSDSDTGTEYHPGFFQRLKSRSKKLPPLPRESPAMSLAQLPRRSTGGSASTLGDSGSERDVEKGGLGVGYKKALQEDTEYRPHGLGGDDNDQDGHIHFAPAVPPKSPFKSPRAAGQATERESSQSSLKVPRPSIAHTAKRQFSFQNVFSRPRSHSHDSDAGEGNIGGGSGWMGKRPRSRKQSKSGAGTEEERLGLVKGDSTVLPIASRDERDVGVDVGVADAGLARFESPESLGPEVSHIRHGGTGSGRGSGSSHGVGNGSGEGMNVRVQDELGREISVRDWERDRAEERDGSGSGSGDGSRRVWKRDLRSADSGKSGGAFI